MASYENIIRAKWLMDDAKTLSEAAKMLREHADFLEEMERAGVQLRDSVDNDYGTVETSDPVIAKKYDMMKTEWDEDEIED